MTEEIKLRINKYLSANGICSRRDADRLVAEGKVTVNGHVAQLGELVGSTDVVKVGKKEVGGGVKEVVLAFYKPYGVVCTERDAHADKIISDYIEYPVRVTYAGRLDKDSEGLLLLSNDGNLIHEMMRGSASHEKEYLVKADREITDDFLKRMEQGVYLKELDRTTKPCKIKKIGKYTFRIILTQGVNRQIRRMCQALSYGVKELKRVRVVNIELGDLRPGQYREITEKEQMLLYESCGMNKQKKEF